MGAACIVSKPVKGKYLLLCMNSIMYFLLTSYNLNTFLKVLSHFVMKIKNFLKYFNEGVLKYFKISMKFLNISKWNISSFIPIYMRHTKNDVGGALRLLISLLRPVIKCQYDL